MVNEKWFEIKIPGDYRAIAKDYGVSPVMARLLHNRGIGSREEAKTYLDADDTDRVYAYDRLPDIDSCTRILSGMIAEGKHIRVIGDYDIDGVCATYILTKGLRELGAKADYAIPHRILDGYGLNDRLIREAKEAGVDCIITCDNGISAAAQTELAHELGMTVIVTDHHEVPYHMEGDRKVEDLPEADAVVDIKREDSKYRFRDICGAQIAFKVVTALCDRMGDRERRAAEGLMELAAFAAIGDVMPLKDENRTLVKQGLLQLEHTENKGMRALLRGQGIGDTVLKPYHVGFILGPCINATGRLATAENAYELLDAATPEEAERIAGQLIAMNADRKDMTEKGLKKALTIAGDKAHSADKVLVIYLPDTHESVAGIIAGKVREQTGKPSFVLTDGEQGIKGSGRSIDEYDMHSAMTEVRDLFAKFGGHRLAGGLSLTEGVTPDMLSERLNGICTLTDDDIAVKVHFDMQLPFAYADMRLASEFSRLEPLGCGNPKPLFAARDVILSDMKVLGRNQNVFKCTAQDASGCRIDAVCFGNAPELMDYAKTKRAAGEGMKLLYYPEINEYRGNRTVQLKIEHYC
ncbi:MAG: single-stranded-DNA-specific exonuclease RecJ [Lachnospiraceae bacterium]|nr:single-stranded-DNA-specific exonuclease RecJ [Lachnospiraceae bacterium]